MSSSVNWSDGLGRGDGTRFSSFTAASPCAIVASLSPGRGLSFGASCLAPASSPSFDTRARSGLACLVAAKTEGEDMGQYVMALYRQSILHLCRPSHCGRVSFMEHMLVQTPRDAGCRVSVAVAVSRSCLAVNSAAGASAGATRAQGSERRCSLNNCETEEGVMSALTMRQTPLCRMRSTEGSATLSGPTCPIWKEAEEPIDCLRTCALAQLHSCALDSSRQDLTSWEAYTRTHLAFSMPPRASVSVLSSSA
jgi:hypothetical protein